MLKINGYKKGPQQREKRIPFREPSFHVVKIGRKRSAPARANRLDKEKPAVRVLLTAGVVPVAGLEPARCRQRWILSFTGCGAMSGL